MLVTLILWLAAAAPAQTTTQTINLQAGWNSVWLELDPTNADVNVVFAGLPVESVWTFQQRLTAVDFIQDPGEPVWNQDQWLVHLPTNRVESVNNNLFQVSSLRPYLIKTTNAAVWNITGRPSVRTVGWVPDAYNLRGYPVDPAVLPTFANFFRSSSAHFNATSNRLERIYKLNNSGDWLLVGPGEVIQRGVAYWTYCNGDSDYQAPLMFALDAVDGLEFAESLDDASLTLINRRTTNVNVLLRDRTAGSPLSLARISPVTGAGWANLPSLLTNTTPPGVPLGLRFGIRRGAMSGTEYASLIELRDGAGTQWLIPVTATRKSSVSGSSPVRYKGLWAGSIRVTAVNEVNNTTNAVSATPAGSQFPLRLLLHVDQAGVTRLLREVVQLWQEGTTTNDAAGLAGTATRGRYVLVTDERLIPAMKGSVLRDGELAGRRLSSSHFDFPTTPGANFLVLSNSFGATNPPLAGRIDLAPTFPRNPFLHRYHPDHDNLDATRTRYAEEAYPVVRQFEFRFSTTNLSGISTPDYGYRIVSGTYQETVTGLNKAPIRATGFFELQRISEIDVLNQ